MLPQEVLRKIRRIEIVTNRLVNESFAGEYGSVFKGRGMEFAEVREYQPGDDIRIVDWNVTSRMGHPFVRRYVEERELTVVLLVDLSASQEFGSGEEAKGEIVAEIAALIAFSAIKNNDKVGAILFTDRIEKVILPAKGSRHALRLVRELLYFKPEGVGTDIAGALRYLNRVVRKKSIVFLVSDFLDVSLGKELRPTARRHDLVALVVRDPRETTVPRAGIVEVTDAETGEVCLVDLSRAAVRERFEQLAAERHEGLLRTLRSGGADAVPILTSEGYEAPLAQFFRERARRFRR